MSFLTEKPPENLEVNGEKYPINTDFRTVLRYIDVYKRQLLDCKQWTMHPDGKTVHLWRQDEPL